MQISICSAADDAATDALVSTHPDGLIYYSARYREFLSRVEPDAECVILGAFCDGRLVGFLSVFLKTSLPFGTIINSQPFFGSHGGVMTSDEVAPHHVKTSLYAALADLAMERGVAALTVIENPFDPLSTADEEALGTVVVDNRIGQFTPLPTEGDIETGILAEMHVKTRNAVRKGKKLALTVRTSTALEDIMWFQGVHAESISALGGVVKPMKVFNTIFDVFAGTDQVRMYVGSVDGQPVCGVLILLFGSTVEYFTPVVEPGHRETQILSALIVDIMVRVAREGYRTWNWGGTWPSQEGVYRFKSRWGAIEHPYRYHNRIFNPALEAAEKTEILSSYPYFYTRKFG